MLMSRSRAARASMRFALTWPTNSSVNCQCAGTRDESMALLDSIDTAPETDRFVITRGIAAWTLYDLANTIFSFSILTIYFPLWIVNDMGGRDGTYGLANSISMALVFLSAPFAGALSDQVPRRIPFLATCAVTCAICTGLIGVV